MLFDIEANFFAAEVIFQGKNFVELTRSCKPSFEAVFNLANQHGASRQSTLRRYVESQDEQVANISYMPSKLLDNNGLSIFQKPWIFPSPSFYKKFPRIHLPLALPPNHQWLEAVRTGDISEGEIDLLCGNEIVRFWYQSWSNKYRLLILIRRKPLLARLKNSWFN